MKIAIVLVACWLGSFLVGCADYRSKGNSDSYRNEAYYSGKPDTVREAEDVDGRSGAHKSAPSAGAPASPVQ